MNRIKNTCPNKKQFALSLIALFLFFISKAQNPPGAGPGGPILVINTSANPFTVYTAEILRAEGLNEFATADISTVTVSLLNNYDVVILGQMSVNVAQVTLLTDWVNAGGTLIAFKPDVLLAPLFGISVPGGTLSDKYLLVNTASGPGAGIVDQTMQFHGAANLHTLSGATSLATLYSDANTPTTNPAVTVSDVGINGGKAIAFTYDLPKSIIYTRQGNPAWIGQKRDGQTGPVRSDDLFFGNAPSDPQTDWIDFNKITIPQADEQQRLLANIILQYNLHHKPLPRFWYLPRALKAAIVMTGDDHAFNGTTGRFNLYNHLSDSIGHNTAQDVADWYAIRGTSYIYSNTPITNSQVVSFQNQGYEIALHPTTNCIDFTPASLENSFVTQLNNFTFNYPGAFSPVTNRTHCMAWSDWATHPKTELNHGIRLDVNYYYWPGAWVQNRNGMFTGSGMPMRFADTDGTMIDCYQATTQMTDESGIAVGAFCDSLLTKATGPEGYYGIFTANMHTDTAIHIGSNAIIASALSKEIPVISAKQLLTWLDGRNNSSFGSISWAGNVLSFNITAAAGSNNLNAMLPFNSGSNVLTQINRNGSPVSFTVSVIKGMQYAFFDASVSGSYSAAYAGSLPVTLTDLSASPNERKITLHWNTSSEINSKRFDVMRSTDGANWNTIGFVAGAENSTTTKEYMYVDYNLEPGRYYYKLKQVDIDERFKYSIIVSASVGSKGAYSLGQNYPNPASNTTTIQYTLPKSGQVNLCLFDMNGKMIKVLVNAPKEAGTHALGFNIEMLSKGIYYYKIQAGSFTGVKKLIKQ
jgi:hypothetical protein